MKRLVYNKKLGIQTLEDRPDLDVVVIWDEGLDGPFPQDMVEKVGGIFPITGLSKSLGFDSVKKEQHDIALAKKVAATGKEAQAWDKIVKHDKSKPLNLKELQEMIENIMDVLIINPEKTK